MTSPSGDLVITTGQAGRRLGVTRGNPDWFVKGLVDMGVLSNVARGKHARVLLREVDELGRTFEKLRGTRTTGHRQEAGS